MDQRMGNTLHHASPASFRRIMIIGTIVTIALLIFFTLWTNYVFSSEEHLQFDLTIINWVQGLVSDSLTPIVIVITEIGYIYVIIPVALIALFYLVFKKKHYWEPIMLAVSILGGDVIKGILKNLLQRERPTFLQVIEETGFSFPSGHSMAAITFYGMLAYIIWINIPGKKVLRTVLVVGTALLILLIGISRIYLGVHYPSDVLAGYTVGGAWLVTCIMALNAIRFYKSDARKQKEVQ